MLASQATDQVTEVTAEQIAEGVAVIEADEVSELQQRAMNTAIECGTYTATALKAMAAWLVSVDDARGAEMVTRFAAEMARHEAVTL